MSSDAHSEMDDTRTSDAFDSQIESICQHFEDVDELIAQKSQRWNNKLEMLEQQAREQLALCRSTDLKRINVEETCLVIVSQRISQLMLRMKEQKSHTKEGRFTGDGKVVSSIVRLTQSLLRTLYIQSFTPRIILRHIPRSFTTLQEANVPSMISFGSFMIPDQPLLAHTVFYSHNIVVNRRINTPLDFAIHPTAPLIYIPDDRHHAVHTFNYITQTFEYLLAKHLRHSFVLNRPIAISCSSDGMTFVVVDASRNQIHLYDSADEYQLTFDPPQSFFVEGRTSELRGLAHDHQDQVHALDIGLYAVHVYSQMGRYLRSYPIAPHVKKPPKHAVIFVNDANEVVISSLSEKFVRVFGQYGEHIRNVALPQVPEETVHIGRGPNGSMFAIIDQKAIYVIDSNSGVVLQQIVVPCRFAAYTRHGSLFYLAKDLRICRR